MKYADRKHLAGGCENRPDVLTIHLTMIYLHRLFKYRTDLKTVFETFCCNGVMCAVLECGFPRLSAEKSRCPVCTVHPLGQADR